MYKQIKYEQTSGRLDLTFLAIHGYSKEFTDKVYDLVYGGGDGGNSYFKAGVDFIDSIIKNIEKSKEKKELFT